MYQKQNFVSGQVLTAEHMNNIEDGLIEVISKPSCFYVCQKDGIYFTMFDFEQLRAMGDSCFGIYVDLDAGGATDILIPFVGDDAHLVFGFESTYNAGHHDCLIFYPDGSIVFEAGDSILGGGSE